MPLTATCEGPSGRAIVAHHALEAPLALCVTMVPPLKSAAARLTVTLDREPPALLALFDDVAKSSPSDSYSVRAGRGRLDDESSAIGPHSRLNLLFMHNHGADRSAMACSCCHPQLCIRTLPEPLNVATARR